jgi:aryl-alcohol dehydrogenase-like predicted oxidoreductase
MTWGDPKGLARLHPAKLAYGGAHGYDEEKKALEVSLAAGIDFFDTAAMYSGGAAERRLGELARGKNALVATKFPGSFFFRTENFPREMEATLARLGRSSVDLYQHHFPAKGVSIPGLMDLSRCRGGRKTKQSGSATIQPNKCVLCAALAKRHAGLQQVSIPCCTGGQRSVAC